MPEAKNEKNYINGVIIKEQVFDNGGKILKVSFKVSEFVEELKACAQDQDYPDWVNVIIARRREPSDKGITHYMFEDEWKPDPTYKKEGYKPQQEADEDEEDLPF